MGKAPSSPPPVVAELAARALFHVSVAVAILKGDCVALRLFVSAFETGKHQRSPLAHEFFVGGDAFHAASSSFLTTADRIQPAPQRGGNRFS